MLTCTLPACILTCNRLTHWQAFKLFLMHVPNYNTHVNTQQNACQHAFEISTCMSKKSTCQHTKNCASTSQECMSTCIQNFNMHVNKKFMSTYKKMHVNIQESACQHTFAISTCMSINITFQHTKNCMSTYKRMHVNMHSKFQHACQ